MGSHRMKASKRVALAAILLWSNWTSAADLPDSPRQLGHNAFTRKEYGTALRHYLTVDHTMEPDVWLNICECQHLLGEHANVKISCQKYIDWFGNKNPYASLAQKWISEAERPSQTAVIRLPEIPKQVVRNTEPTQPLPDQIIKNDTSRPSSIPTLLHPEIANPITSEPRPDPPAIVAVKCQPCETVPQTIEQKTRNTGLWSAGLTLWLSSYAAAAAIGLHDGLSPSSTTTRLSAGEARYSLWLAAPLIGPFVSGALRPLEHPEQREDLLLSWTLPWIVADGLSQVAGLSMLIAGAQRRSLAGQLSRSLHTVVLPGGGALVFGEEF